MQKVNYICPTFKLNKKQSACTGWGKRLVGWEINVPFQHKNRLYQGQGLGWRFSSIRLKMAKMKHPGDLPHTVPDRPPPPLSGAKTGQSPL